MVLKESVLNTECGVGTVKKNGHEADYDGEEDIGQHLVTTIIFH
jgi:hypothetical protein